MRPRQPLPSTWLMTDERQGDRLWSALEALPRGSGIVFRHYGLGYSARRELFRQVRAIARRRRLLLLLAGPPRLARAWGADGSHGLHPGCWRLRTASAHDAREMRRAERIGADLLFLSPVFPTRSHPGAPALGRVRLGLLARHARRPVIALGGVTPERSRHLKALGCYGWAGIDAWTMPGGAKIRT